MKISNIKYKTTDGFTLLFAVLTSSLLLVVGLSIFNIAMKQSKLTFAARDSQTAFYSSDSGLECALYWDLNGNFFNPKDISTRDITCLGQTHSLAGNNSNIQDFSFVFDDSRYCVTIKIEKNISLPSTVIKSIGSSAAPCGSSDLVTERALEFSY